jgi:protein-S-isoprenylcysteine O-methyltransferase Ste14
MMPLLLWRLLDEEKSLARDLPGYAAYRQRVRSRLVPCVW